MPSIGNYTEEYLLGRAEELVISKSEGSVIFDKSAEDRVPRFAPEGESCDWYLLTTSGDARNDNYFLLTQKFFLKRCLEKEDFAL